MLPAFKTNMIKLRKQKKTTFTTMHKQMLTRSGAVRQRYA